MNAAEFEVFATHRRELQEFARIVAGDRVEFAYQSYPDLWRAWDTPHGLMNLREHVDRLRRRYLVRL